MRPRRCWLVTETDASPKSRIQLRAGEDQDTACVLTRYDRSSAIVTWFLQMRS